MAGAPRPWQRELVHPLARAVLALAALLVSLLVAALLLQRNLLYFPERFELGAALARSFRLGLAPWLDPSGGLRGWRRSPVAGPSPRARLLVLHGNAGSALDRIAYLPALQPRGVEVVLLEYPGYGARPGSPSQQALTAAAVEAIDALAAEGAPIWLLGESLGSGVAAAATAQRPTLVRGLLLVTPFAELTAVARHHYPFLPTWLLLDRWAPLRDLAGWHGPAVLLLAGADEVVTRSEGERLFAALAGPKRLQVEDGAGHNGLDLSPGLAFWDQVVDFLAAPR
jgi:pimeloyl-ACP methyl ester carboxylesterase